MGAEASNPGDRQTNPRDLPSPFRPRTSTSSGSKRSGLQEAFDCRCILFPATCFGRSLCVNVCAANFFAVYSLATASPLVSSAQLIYFSSCYMHFMYHLPLFFSLSSSKPVRAQAAEGDQIKKEQLHPQSYGGWIALIVHKHPCRPPQREKCRLS